MLEFNRKVLNNEYDLYLTRYTDTLISLRHRTKLVKAIQPDLFISLHCNHAKNERATGVEIYLHSKTSITTKNQVESMRLGQSIVEKRLLKNWDIEVGDLKEQTFKYYANR